MRIDKCHKKLHKPTVFQEYSLKIPKKMPKKGSRLQTLPEMRTPYYGQRSLRQPLFPSKSQFCPITELALPFLLLLFLHGCVFFL